MRIMIALVLLAMDTVHGRSWFTFWRGEKSLVKRPTTAVTGLKSHGGTGTVCVDKWSAFAQIKGYDPSGKTGYFNSAHPGPSTDYESKNSKFKFKTRSKKPRADGTAESYYTHDSHELIADSYKINKIWFPWMDANGNDTYWDCPGAYEYIEYMEINAPQPHMEYSDLLTVDDGDTFWSGWNFTFGQDAQDISWVVALVGTVVGMWVLPIIAYVGMFGLGTFCLGQYTWCRISTTVKQAGRGELNHIDPLQWGETIAVGILGVPMFFYLLSHFLTQTIGFDPLAPIKQFLC